MPMIHVNNINLYYESDGQGESIIFVTGFTANHLAWQNTIDAYRENYQTIVFDNRGIGQSDCPDYPYTTEMMAKDTVELARGLGIKSAHFIGASFGGCIVQTIAYQYPEMMKSMVLVNTFDTFSMRGKLYADIRQELIQANVSPESILKFITMLCWSESYLSQPGKVEQLVERGFSSITLAGYKNQLHAMMNFDSREWLDKIRVPCLVLAGRDDVLVPTSQSERLAKAIAGAEYYFFDNVGHVPQLEQPELFNQLAKKFINRCKAKNSSRQNRISH